ncbi:hypothetical protein INT45_005872 [Circinella minor]|uniref:Uncharacterized protein n=1 Tax=Circinella minor TaxID=1195481 RepID=A0A8H7S246_9FUNG|nr:hypothetical protein INT45_005872 [Circinella minor]
MVDATGGLGDGATRLLVSHNDDKVVLRDRLNKEEVDVVDDAGEEGVVLLLVMDELSSPDVGSPGDGERYLDCHRSIFGVRKADMEGEEVVAIRNILKLS